MYKFKVVLPGMRVFKLFIPLLALALMGAGCFDLGGKKTTDDGGVWKSSDAGLTWVQSVALPTTQGVGSLNQINVLTLAMDPQDRQAIYLGSRESGMFWSYDGGMSWMRPRDASLGSGQVLRIAVDPADKCTIYALRSTQLAKSTDCGRTFDPEMYVESRSGVTLTDVEVDWFNPQIVWLATSDGDILKSENGGENWTTKKRVSRPVVDLLIDNGDSRILFAATDRQFLYKSVDGGEDWDSLEEKVEKYKEANLVTDLTQDATGEVLIVSTEYGLLRTADDGETWEKIKLLTAAREVSISAVAVDPTDPDKIYYTTAATFYSTADGGTNWQTRRLTTGRTITELLIDPTNPQIMYLGGANFE